MVALGGGTGSEDPPPYQLARVEVPSSLSVEVVTPGSEPSLPPPEEESLPAEGSVPL